jgi:hypothetical protein
VRLGLLRWSSNGALGRKLRIKEALDIFLGTFFLTSFFLHMFNIGSMEKIGKRIIVIGNRAILRIYTKVVEL